MGIYVANPLMPSTAEESIPLPWTFSAESRMVAAMRAGISVLLENIPVSSARLFSLAKTAAGLYPRVGAQRARARGMLL